MQTLTIFDFLEKISEPNKSRCKNLWIENKERFENAPGSSFKHQAWKRGYEDHLLETMKIAENLYSSMSTYRSLQFELSDAILVLFLHDLEKPFKYVDPKVSFNNDDEKHIFIFDLIKKFQIELGDEHVNALTYIHGEGDEYNPHTRIQGPLGAFVHMCDVASARIWFDFPAR